MIAQELELVVSVSITCADTRLNPTDSNNALIIYFFIIVILLFYNAMGGVSKGKRLFLDLLFLV